MFCLKFRPERRNEEANQLATEWIDTPLTGSEPVCGIECSTAKRSSQYWVKRERQGVKSVKVLRKTLIWGPTSSLAEIPGQIKQG